ncbi:polysaccharide biosynthesis protein [Desertivirga xinjiangensis]|uniref:polysaccharide biosynthesis protein n=1 Tax=Desertivirga xinjiangensis TaxID=539206 RepID=UPI00210E6ECD|nr:nucleoside-diphosphate sugar epimerase/dehydratase [Pedobacter xinjiangensis]
MKKTLLREKVHSRWLILLIDQVIVCWAFSMSFLMTSRVTYTDMFPANFLPYLGLFSAVSISVFMTKRVHNGIIRYSNTEDILRIFSAVLTCNVIYWILVQLVVKANIHIVWPQLMEAVILNFFLSSTVLVMLRLGVKNIFNVLKSEEKQEFKTILIYGSGRSSVLLKQALENHPQIKYKVVGFVDSDIDKVGKEIEQKQVYNFYAIAALKEKHKVNELIVMSNSLSKHGQKQAVEECIELGIKVLTVPPADKWLNGQLSVNQIKDLKIEDLLQREPIVLIKQNIIKQLSGKTVLVTGAAGSIGSEIVRQVLSYNPRLIILCDQAESPLHELQLELEDNQMAAKVKVCIANIQNLTSMRSIFTAYQPQIVFHAAAYKHVPMMENNPREAILSNVMGTKNIADLSMEFLVEKFIMISTDKAVNPTNVMGASKRLAEMYIQSLNSSFNKTSHEKLLEDSGFYMPENRNTHTRFITTRFGNVLGSNGSVIPRFKAQIERGGPVTVTHPDITRYFMTIPESVQLVLEAGAMGQGGEIFIFDMGKPIRIADLARNMIKLAGLVPDKDIHLEYTGLRPGEKLYEELLNKEEFNIPTHHHKIKISSVIVYPFIFIQEKIHDLLSLNEAGNEVEVVRKMKEIIPEYRSNNSRFEELDSVAEVYH